MTKDNWGHEARSVVRTAAVVLLLMSGLVACGGQNARTAGDWTIFVHGGSLVPAGGEDALISGMLVARDGCVLLQMGDIAYPPIWPSGTSISLEDPLTLKLPSGEELTVGQVVSGGGGFHDIASEQVQVDIPDQCVPDTGEIAIFNPDADLTIED